MLTDNQKASLLYKKHLGYGETSEKRDYYEESIKSSFAISPNQLLMYGDKIPCSNEDPELLKLIHNLKDEEIYYWQKDEATKIPIVQFHENVQMVKIDNGTDNAFKLVDKNGELYKNIIPFNYYRDLYNYSIHTQDGKKIYFGTGEWILDTYSSILKFYGKIPNGIDHEHPPIISFYQYVGGNGFRQDTYGYDGVIMPINNWFISKDTYLIDLTNTDNNGTELTLESAIIKQADKVIENFAGTFGFDGSNTNEGVAYSLEKLVNLQYTATKDVVKGYDKSKDSNICVLLSRLSSSGENLNITYTSQNITLGEHTLHKNQTVVNFDDSAWVSITDITKITNPDGEFIILEGLDTLSDGEYTFTTSETTTSGILLYWSAEDRSYVPYINKEEDFYDFGFPLVTANGRIPPEVKIGATSLGFYNDAITPEYYGPRTFTVTIAVEDGTNIKSADYVVRNRDGFYLNDIFSQIEKDFPNFIGTVYLRAGIYKTNIPLDLSKFKNLILLGEDKGTTIIKGDLLYNAIFENGLVTIKELTFNDLNMSNNTVDFIIKSCVLANADITKSKNNLFIKESSLEKLIIKGTISELNEKEIVNHLYSDIISSVDIQTGHTYYNGCNIYELSLSDVEADVIKSCIIQSCKNKPIQTNILDSTVLSFIAPKKYTTIPSTRSFPIYSKDNKNNLEYASFGPPFYINWAEGVNSLDRNIIEIKIDSNYLHIDAETGELTCNLNADFIMVDTNRLERHTSYEGESPTFGATEDGRKSLQLVLQDAFLTKADLNPNGKIPLDELPDSVAYGGLLYVGTWSFERKSGDTYIDGGLYPTYNDALKNLTEDNDQNGVIQPGWFWIVSSSQKDPDKPVAEQRAAIQSVTYIKNNKEFSYKDEGLVFTAGDWIIWNGSYFEKLDRAYNDIAYMTLPVYTPGVDNEGHYNWSWNRRSNLDYEYGYGALDLNGETVAEAFDMINQELFNLRVKHPATCRDIVLVPVKDYKQISYYPIVDSKVSPILSTKYDLTKDEEVKHFRVKTQHKENLPYKSGIIEDGIYVASDNEEDYATLNFYISNNQKMIDQKAWYFYTATVKGSDVLPQRDEANNYEISAPYDPYKDYIVGKGYWKSVTASFGPESKEIIDGNYDYQIDISDICPRHTVNEDAICHSDKLSISVISPYDFIKNPTTIDEVDNVTNINSTEIEVQEANDACSGIYKISNSVNLKFGFTISGCMKEVNSERKVAILTDGMHNIEKPIDEAYVKFTAAKDDELYNLVVSNMPFEYKVERVAEGFDFRVQLFDAYTNKRIYKLGYENFTIRTDPTTEFERVYSGHGLYPTYGNTDIACGSAYDHEAPLNVGAYIGELLKIGRMYNNQVISEYKWPFGQYHSLSKLVDYMSLSNVGMNIDGNQYRFATFNKFWNGEDYQEIILKEATGFFLNINISEDQLNNWTADEYSMRTDNIILQIKVVNMPQNSPEDSIETEWMDANEPYNGFAEIGTENGQACMYAGTSSATKKRITFGTKTYSGKVIVRLGIKAKSPLAFQNISIQNII